MQKKARSERIDTRAIGWTFFTLTIVIGCSLTVLFRGNIVSLLAAATSSIMKAPVVVYFSPQDTTELSLGATTEVDLDIDASVPINALGVTLQYPKDSLEIVGINKQKSFLDLWTEDTVIKEDSGELHFSGGTTAKGGLIGTSTILTILVKSKKEGDANMSVEDLQVFADDGKGSLLRSDSRPITFSSPPRATEAGSGSHVSALEPSQAIPYDLNGDGKITLVDVSILILHLVMPYDAHFDLDHDGAVGLSDLSVLFSHMSAQ